MPVKNIQIGDRVRWGRHDGIAVRLGADRRDAAHCLDVLADDGRVFASVPMHELVVVSGRNGNDLAHAPDIEISATFPKLGEMLLGFARQAMASGVLPGPAPARHWKRAADGRICALCNTPIAGGDQIEVAMSERTLNLHAECYTAWRRVSGED